jgi:hypothetical protein
VDLYPEIADLDPTEPTLATDLGLEPAENCFRCDEV